MVARCYCLLGGLICSDFLRGDGSLGNWLPGDWPASWLLAESDQPLWTRLEPRDRVRVLAAILVLLVLCFGLMALVIWGSRWTRRYMNRKPARMLEKKSNPVSPDDWAKKPLHSAGDDPLENQ